VCKSNTQMAEEYARQMSRTLNLRQQMPRCDGAPSDENCKRKAEHLDGSYDVFMVQLAMCR
jgi:hypothetical protein